MVFYGDFMDFQIFQITTEHQMSETQGRFDDSIDLMTLRFELWLTAELAPGHDAGG